MHKNSKPHENLKSVVFDSKFLANIGYYTKFRYTGAIENFNSMLITYAPKRMSFDYVCLVMSVFNTVKECHDYISRMVWQQWTTTCMDFGLLQQQQMEETAIGENIIRTLRISMLSL